MFNYQGNSTGFREDINRYSAKLEQVYRSILGKKLLEYVTNLISPKLLFTQPRGQSTAQSVMASIDNLFETADMNFLWQAISSVDLDETLTRELDRRVILGLGYNPTAWIETQSSSSEAELAQFKEVAERRQKYFRGLDNAGLSNFIVKWDKYIAPDNTLLNNFVKSAQPYRIRKITSDQVPDLDSILMSGRAIGFGSDRDNYAGAMVLAPAQDKIMMTDEGRLVLKDTSRILTAPFIVLSDEGVENHTAVQLQGSNLPPYLVAFVHEFNHFVLYCLQNLPLNITAGLFYGKAVEQKL